MNKWLVALLLCAAPVLGGGSVDFEFDNSEGVCWDDPPILSGATTATFAYWFQLETKTTNVDHYFFGKTAGVGDRSFAASYTTWAGYDFTFKVSDDSGGEEAIISDPTFSAGEWHFVLGVWDASGGGDAWDVYFDGSVETDSETHNGSGTAAIDDNTTDLTIGGRGGDSSCGYVCCSFDGELAHIQMWDRKLDEAERAEARWKPGCVTDGLVFHAPLMEGGSGNAPAQIDLVANDASDAMNGTPQVGTEGPPIIGTCGGSR